MRLVFKIVLFTIVSADIFGQMPLTDTQLDSLIQNVREVRQVDTIRLEQLIQIGYNYTGRNQEIASKYFKEALDIADHFPDDDRKLGIFISLGFGYSQCGKIPESIAILQRALPMCPPRSSELSITSAFIGIGLKAQGDYEKAMTYIKQSNDIIQYQIDNHIPLDQRGIYAGPYEIGDLYFKINKLDSALVWAKLGVSRIDGMPGMDYFFTNNYLLLGKVYGRINKLDSALHYFSLAQKHAAISQSLAAIAETNLQIGTYFNDVNNLDSAIVYSQNSYLNYQDFHGYDGMTAAATLVRKIFAKKNDFFNALKYADLAQEAQDSISGAAKTRQVQTMVFNNQLKQEEIKNAVLSEKQKNKIGLLGILLSGTLLLAIILYRFFTLKQKDNKLLSAQNEKIELQKGLLESSLTDLKKAQTQLIHAAKMASLGELTAGIAHEIQNPLNFVNNFSQLNGELISEIKEENSKTEKDEHLINDLLHDVEKNSIKINNHGLRAANIVKGMLEHSRAENHERQFVDINKLLSDYLQLVIQASNFTNSTSAIDIVKELDPQLPKVEVIPENLGRVFINIFNNSFYALNEKSKKTDVKMGYVPKLSLQTKYFPNQNGKNVEIRILDNGSGIPEEIRSKIFQPFFTTKPTGQGTGLGLSLSYDIITKGHEGQLSVNSEVGNFTEFVISLPEIN